ncbi:endonuclease/exonuclease/phosphatase family protein [Actinoplanes sp. TFC3]|uniref:endonuclease/exonuclease/phosphatase family protein n=1 Tax=Actinoplanes sp. TFC3 TaxID=1710355 RepID=UPI00083352E5|nr:endonuclease/exonuclease/phosphatase family protein [Actinoplanes sp. TFC3]
MRKWSAYVLSAGWFAYTVLNLVLSGEWALWLLPNLVPPLAFVVVPPVLALLGLAVRGARWVVTVTALGSLVLGAGQAGLNLEHQDSPVPAGAIKVVSWNTEAWHLSGDPDGFYRFLQAQDADVYLLQEYQPADQSITRALAGIDETLIPQHLPGYRAIAVGELLVLTRLAVTGIRPLPAPPPAGAPWRYAYDTVKSLRVDLNIGGHAVSFYDVHIPVPIDLGQSPLSAGFYRAIGDRAAQRDAQWSALAADVAANPAPILLAGDLNSTPAMGELHRLPGKLHDAAPAMDTFYPGSWPRGTALWRLDWLFTTTGLAVHRYTFTSPPGMSDHRLQTVLLTPGGSS